MWTFHPLVAISWLDASPLVSVGKQGEELAGVSSGHVASVLLTDSSTQCFPSFSLVP